MPSKSGPVLLPRRRSRTRSRLAWKPAAVVVAAALTALPAESARAATSTGPQVAAALTPQVVPPDSGLTIALDLTVFGSYSLPLDPPSGGRLVVGWYAGTHLQLPTGSVPWLLVASGQTRYGHGGHSRLRMTATRQGQRLIGRAHSLRLTSVAYFTPTRQPRVTILQPFTLS